MAKVLTLKLASHFQTDTLGKEIDPFITLSYGLNNITAVLIEG